MSVVYNVLAAASSVAGVVLLMNHEAALAAYCQSLCVMHILLSREHRERSK